jgi:hypothetical protein
MHTDSPSLGQGYCQVIEKFEFSHILKEFHLVEYFIYINNSNQYVEGKVSAGINKEGIKYYNNLINELLDNGNAYSIYFIKYIIFMMFIIIL